MLTDLANYYLGVKLNGALDQKYPLTKIIKIEEKELLDGPWHFLNIGFYNFVLFLISYEFFITDRSDNALIKSIIIL
ncbi:hypothetical protein GCM10017706_30080 [Lactococcus lactis subsp. hordniae]